ncbi:MAG: CRISPR-associated protein Csx16 [Acidobacteria bacterium]|jgi:CRISPR-associated protein Csx16|nr:CRISPR-associated protein Csx16 [Acidobacteriota bacterium]
MATYFVTRHGGALEWAARHNIRIDHALSHLRIEEIQPGDVVIGVLPVHLAAEVCAKSARYIQIAMDLPEQCRGIELSGDDMERHGARLVEYRVERVRCM